MSWKVDVAIKHLQALGCLVGLHDYTKRSRRVQRKINRCSVRAFICKSCQKQKIDYTYHQKIPRAFTKNYTSEGIIIGAKRKEGLCPQI